MRIKSVYLTWHFCNKWIKCEVTSSHTDILRQPCRQFSSVQLAHSFQKRDLISAPVWLGHNMPRRQFQCFSFSLARPHECRAIGKLLPLCWGAFAFALNGLKGIEALRCDDLVKKTGQSLRSWRTCQLFDMKKKTTLNFGSVVVFTSLDQWSCSLQRTEFLQWSLLVLQFSITRGATRRSRDAKSDRKRYSIVMLFTTSFPDGDD